MAKTAKSRPRCSACGKVVGAGHRFCPHCGTPIHRMAEAEPSARARVIAGPSLQVKTERADALEEQRKVVTVMFVDLTGSTPIAERLDPEEWRGVLQRYFAVLSRQIERYGGTIDKYIGDAVMAVFGAPIAREDDPHRAINAALAIKAEIAKENEELDHRYGVRLNLRIGINSGEVVAGLLAGGVEGAYTVTGDTVNTAQRLESVAPANEILVGEATYQLTRRAFVFEQLPLVALKGKKEPVAAYRVIMRERRAVPREGRSAFIGRDVELARLRDLFAQASAGRGQLAHVYGEAGVGKSRLIQEFFDSLPEGSDRLRPRATSYETSTAYALIADLLRRAFRIQAGLDEATAQLGLVTGLESLALRRDETMIALLLEVLGYEQRANLDPEGKRRLLVSTLRRFLAERSRHSTFVVVAEDVHWMDQASASVLAEVLREVRSLACLFVTTSRDEGLPWSAAKIGLGPLDEAAAADMLERVTGAPLDPKLRAVVLERTAGNPFFIEEVVRALGARGAGTVPATVQELLQARLDGLDPEAKRAAQRAAVIGRTFTTRLLGRISAELPLDRALGALEAAGFIVARSGAPEPAYAFRHALLQEAAYQVQLMAQRRATHGVVGQAIEDLYQGRLDEFIDVLAFHYDRSEFDDKAVTWVSRAGERAKRLFANDEAIAHLGRAAERARRQLGFAGTLPEILVSLAEVHQLVGHYDEALRLFTEVREANNDVRAWQGTAAVLRRRGEYASALTVLDEAFASDGLRDRDLLPLWLERAWTLSESGRFPEAIEVLRAGLAAAGSRRDPVVAQLLLRLARAEAVEGHAEDALARALEAKRIADEHDDTLGRIAALRLLGDAFRVLQRFDEAAEALSQALELGERVGSVLEVAQSSVNLGMVEARRGRLDEAIAYDRKAIEELRRIGHRGGEAIAQGNLAGHLVLQGRFDEALPYCEKALELARANGQLHIVADATKTLASIRAAQGAYAEAAARAEEAAELFVKVGAAPHAADSLKVAADAWEKAREAERARDALARARSLASNGRD